MTIICKRTVAILALINIIAVFYLNFTIELSVVAHFVVLPWLALQSLLMFSIVKSQNTNSNSN